MESGRTRTGVLPVGGFRGLNFRSYFLLAGCPAGYAAPTMRRHESISQSVPQRGQGAVGSLAYRQIVAPQLGQQPSALPFPALRRRWGWGLSSTHFDIRAFDCSFLISGRTGLRPAPSRLPPIIGVFLAGHASKAPPLFAGTPQISLREVQATGRTPTMAHLCANSRTPILWRFRAPPY